MHRRPRLVSRSACATSTAMWSMAAGATAAVVIVGAQYVDRGGLGVRCASAGLYP